jgi:activator of 2-hydroxyglutaryl-CoA dehydratase
MAVAGIDMGAQSTKVVILEGDRVLAAVTLQTGESGESEARQALEEALRQVRLKLGDVKSVVATGAGRKDVPFARKQRSIATCLARGAHFLFPQARTVLDAGAESSTAVRRSAEGTVEGSASKDKMDAKLETLVLVPDEPQMVGALGAALLAQEGSAEC